MAAAPSPGRLRKIAYMGDPLAAPPPSELMGVLDRYRGQHDVLVTVLQQIQSVHGYLPKRSVQYAARELGVPLARLYGVATFYNQFRFTPPGRHAIQVCRGTACHVAGSSTLVAGISAALGVAQDETTPDGMFSLQTVACVGCCSLAPVMVVNHDVHGSLTAERVGEILDRYAGSAEAAPAGEGKV